MSRVVVRRWALATACLVGGSAPADEAVLTAVYGDGIKSFYAGRYVDAFDTFSQAIEAGSTDPRCYYFRGLAQLRLGRAPDAKLDFEKGAQIEAQDFDVFYNVSEALQRVQGPERLLLERYRAAGRKTALAEIEKIRLEYFRRFEPQTAVAGAASVSGGGAAIAPMTPPGGEAPAVPADESNPFGGTAAPAAPAGNPFGGTP